MAASSRSCTASCSSTSALRAPAPGASTPRYRSRVHRRTFGLLSAAAIGATQIGPTIARGQGRWKADKPITIYNPFAAGGGTDVHLRLLGETAGPILGQPILVDSRPGAAGTLAPALLLNAKPDGHQLACMSINSLRYPHYQPTSWNPIRDFTYIVGLTGCTIGIVVREDAPWKTLEELIAEIGRAHV